MTQITIGSLAEEPAARPSWDSRWVGDATTPAGHCDWATAGDDEAGNRGGLAATQPIETAILLCLFTDRRLPDEMADPTDFDRRGWHGDTFDLDRNAGERPMGSLLWTLDRAALSAGTARLAEHYAAEALQTLIDQRVVRSFDIAAEVDGQNAMLKLEIVAYGPSGEAIYAGGLPVL